MKRIGTCAAAFLLIVGLAPSYAGGGPGGGRPATAGARAKGPKTATSAKAKASGPKSAGAGAVAHGKSSAPGQAKKATATADAKPDADGPKVPKSEKLQAKLQAKLGDMPLDEAAEGFKNQGQFIAAVHAADRLDVPFEDFKAKMLGGDGAEALSLGQTIQFFNPEGDADTEVEIAESQARQDLK
jgi:hypothetical protein